LDSQKFIKTLFKKITLYIAQKVLIPCEFLINTNNSFNLIFFPKIGKVLGCYRLPPLKGISSLRFGEAKRKGGFGILKFRVLGGYHP
jgi:hypothetical protein